MYDGSLLITYMNGIVNNDTEALYAILWSQYTHTALSITLNVAVIKAHNSRMCRPETRLTDQGIRHSNASSRRF